jgi:hypothetical protein
MLTKDMKTQKNNILLKILTIALFTAVSIITVQTADTSQAYAAPAGCYARSSLGGEVSIEEYNCPTEGYARGVGTGNCYVFAAGSSGVSPTGVLTDCESITVGRTAVQSPSGSAGGVDAGSAIVGGSAPNTEQCKKTPLQANDDCLILKYTVAGINFLSALAGIALIASLMIAGFQYMTAQDDPGKVQKSKARIIQTLIALLLFIFMYSLLNFLVPGGVLPG